MAVRTVVSEAEAEAFLARYGVGGLESLAGIEAGSENTNYFLDAGGGRYVLTLFEDRVEEADLPFFLGLLERVSGSGVACPRPVRARDGALFGRLNGRPAAVTTFLPGKSIENPTPRHCFAVGRALADLHVASGRIAAAPQNPLDCAAVRRLVGESRAGLERVDPAWARRLDAEVALLSATAPEGLPVGVIHGDLFPDNVFFRGGEVCGLIDFYFACEDRLAYDLAICFVAWCTEKESGRIDHGRALGLFAGYGSRRRLVEAEVGAMGWLARLAVARFLATRMADEAAGRGLRDWREYAAKHEALGGAQAADENARLARATPARW